MFDIYFEIYKNGKKVFEFTEQGLIIVDRNDSTILLKNRLEVPIKVHNSTDILSVLKDFARIEQAEIRWL